MNRCISVHAWNRPAAAAPPFRRHVLKRLIIDLCHANSSDTILVYCFVFQAYDPSHFHCNVCDLPLTGRLHAESHYMGRNHQKLVVFKIRFFANIIYRLFVSKELCWVIKIRRVKVTMMPMVNGYGNCPRAS